MTTSRRGAVVAMKETPLAPSRLAVEQAAREAGKKIEIETICVESAANCLKETGDTALADQYFERYLRLHQKEYHAFVIPQVPLTRIMPRIRDLDTPVFDSMEPFMEELAKGNEIGTNKKTASGEAVFLPQGSRKSWKRRGLPSNRAFAIMRETKGGNADGDAVDSL